MLLVGPQGLVYKVDVWHRCVLLSRGLLDLQLLRLGPVPPLLVGVQIFRDPSELPQLRTAPQSNVATVRELDFRLSPNDLLSVGNGGHMAHPRHERFIASFFHLPELLF